MNVNDVIAILIFPFSLILAMESYKMHVDKEALKRTSEMLGVRRECDSINE